MTSLLLTAGFSNHCTPRSPCSWLSWASFIHGPCCLSSSLSSDSCHLSSPQGALAALLAFSQFQWPQEWALSHFLQYDFPYLFQPIVWSIFVSTTERMMCVLRQESRESEPHVACTTTRRCPRLPAIHQHGATLRRPHNSLSYSHPLHFLKVTLALKILQNDICERIINWSVRKKQKLEKESVAWG